jgi:hypothetical protein
MLGFSAEGIDLNDIFGSLCEGKPKTIYYRPFPVSSASSAWHLPQVIENFATSNDPAGPNSFCFRLLEKERTLRKIAILM